jgi:hypothetical protein
MTSVASMKTTCGFCRSSEHQRRAAGRQSPCKTPPTPQDTRTVDRGREGGRNEVSSPSLRTVLAVFLHTALQLEVARNGLSETKVGLAQTVETQFRKVVISTLTSPCVLVIATHCWQKQVIEPEFQFRFFAKISPV